MTQGFHNFTNAEYHSDKAPEPSLSSGMAKLIYTQCPAVAWHNSPRLNPDLRASSGTQVMNIGTIAHALLLEGSESGVVVINPEDYPSKNGEVPKGWTNNAIREARDEAISFGKLPIFEKDFAQVRQMVGAARKAIMNSELAGVFDNGEPEISALWKQHECWNRARYDLLNRKMGIVLDYKTTDGSADPLQWIDRQIDRMGYDIQAAHYLDGLAEIEGSDYKWVWLLQEQNPPYLCSLIGAGNTTLALGHKKVDYARKVFSECLQSGIWPGYGGNIFWSEPQPWQLAAAEQKDIIEGWE